MVDESGCRGCVKRFQTAVLRTKPLDREAMMETPLKRSLKQFHVLMYGIGTMIGNAIYGVVAVTAREYSGPSTCLCFLLAGFVGLLNGMCYSELSAQIPKAGSAFVYTYVIAGELLAFMAGWFALLEYISTASSAAVLASNTINILSNGTLNDFIGTYIGELTRSGGSVFNQYPNLLAFIIALLATVVLTCGNDASFMINCILSVVTLVVISMATIFMYTKFDANYMLNKRHDLFFPNDVNGFLSGSGIAFGTFIGFEAMTVAGEEVHDPQRTIPKATFKAIGIVCFISVVHSLAFTGYTKWWDVDPNFGLAAIFSHPPVIWLQIIVSVSTVVAAFCSILCSLYAITRITYSMASDGLMFKFLGWIQPKLQVPIISLYVFGVLCGIAAIFFSYSALTSFMSISAVLAYIIVSCDLLIIRYMKPELYPDEPSKGVGFLRTTFQNIKCLKSKSKGTIPCLVLIFFMISSSAALYFFMDASGAIYRGYWWAASVLSLLCSVVIACVVIIAMFQPFKERSEFFMVPFVPYVPLLSIFLNIAVIIKLPLDSWTRVLMWIVLGLVLYFLYGMWHSTLREKPSIDEANDSVEISLDKEAPTTPTSDDDVWNTDAIISVNEKTPIIPH